MNDFLASPAVLPSLRSLNTSPLLEAAMRIITILFFAAALFIVIDYARMLRMRRQLPPGPLPLPIIGNHMHIPKSKPWITFEAWSKQYKNPLLTVWLGRRPIIVANDAWTASELMEKRANLYSSRPRIVVMGDVLNQTDSNQVNLVYGDQWRLHRRLTHTVVGSQAVRDHREIQSNESKVLTLDMLSDPDDYVMSIERYSVSVVSIIGWGRRIARKNDYVAQQALALMETACDVIIPGAFWMESIPLLAELPGWLYALPSAFRTGAKLGQRYFYMLSEEGAKAKEDNFSKRIMTAQKEHGLTDAEVAGLTANLIGGGVDTTSSTMISCILAMITFPDVQKRAQEEIDRVIGHQRSPNSDDEASLPYIAAIVKETLRWRTVTILGGIPHAPIKDDVYRGYHIPAGTNITGNLWAIHRNPDDFPEPDRFKPERYLNGTERPYPNTRGHNAFGWGRRQCSGQPLAEQGLFMSLARLIWAFNIQPGLDDAGNEIVPDIFAYTDSENMRPQPFKARFTPRSAAIEELIRKEAEEATRFLSRWDGETKLTMADVIGK